MKLTIKVKRINSNLPIPTVIDKGDWIDLRVSETVQLNAPQAGILKKKTIDGKDVSFRDVSFDTKLLKLGVAFKLPDGFEAIVSPRSSTPKLGVIQSNSQGIIDSSFCGNTDEWRYWVTALKATTINEGDRICQFRIQLSQKATMWQKLKWLFCSGIKIVEVDNLESSNRGGIGTTGLQ